MQGRTGAARLALMMRALALGSFIAGLALVGACEYPGAGPASPSARRPIPFDARATPHVALHYRAGTRLRPRWRVTRDGARELLGIRDTKLGIDCKFLPTPDGLRCVPDPALDETLRDTATSFRDAECKEPAAWGIGRTEPAFIVAHDYMQTDCPEAEMRVYRAENARRVTTLHSRYFDQSCGGRVSLSGGISTATRGPELTALLVRGKRVVVGDGSGDFGGLAVGYVEAEDGAVVFDSWVDPRLDAPCSFALAGDGAIRCLPRGAPTTLFFDDTCTAAGATTRCAPPRFVLEPDARCATRTRARRVGKSRPGSYWLKNDIDCIQQTIDARGTTTYAPAAEIAPAQLTAAASMTDASSRRLHANTVAVGAYREIFAPKWARWHDAKLDVDCSFELAADGVERCLPWAWVSHVQGFSDPQCTSESRPVYVGDPVEDACAPTAATPAPAPRFIRLPADRSEPSMLGPEPPPRIRVDELGPWPSGVPLYVRRNRACIAVTATEVATMRTPIAEVAPAVFEEAHEAIE